MNDYTQLQMMRFMGILKAMKLTKDQVLGICSFMKKEEMVTEILQRLKEKKFKTNPQETMNICTAVIKENL